MVNAKLAKTKARKLYGIKDIKEIKDIEDLTKTDIINRILNRTNIVEYNLKKKGNKFKLDEIIEGLGNTLNKWNKKKLISYYKKNEILKIKTNYNFEKSANIKRETFSFPFDIKSSNTKQWEKWKNKYGIFGEKHKLIKLTKKKIINDYLEKHLKRETKNNKLLIEQIKKYLMKINKTHLLNLYDEYEKITKEEEPVKKPAKKPVKKPVKKKVVKKPVELAFGKPKPYKQIKKRRVLEKKITNLKKKGRVEVRKDNAKIKPKRKILKVRPKYIKTNEGLVGYINQLKKKFLSF